MGTTEKLGVGVNIQDRLLAAHHIDVPDRPMDFEQRNGRIWRPGNLNEEIEILVYGVKNTLDSTGFQRLLIKQKFINQLMRGDITDRTFDDPFDPTQASFQDMMAAFGNPKVREKFGLENQIRDLMTLKDSHEKEIARARDGNSPGPGSDPNLPGGPGILGERLQRAGRGFPGRKGALPFPWKRMERWPP